MRAVYRKSDGSYCDNEQSMVNPPKKNEDLIRRLPNALPRLGGQVSDYVVEETTQPHLKKYSSRLFGLLGSRLVEDTDKIAAMQSAAERVDAERARRQALLDKVEARSATLEEIQEFITLKGD